MSTLTIGSLFSGYGGLDLAVESVTGARTVIAQAAEIERLKTALTDHLRQEADGWVDQ